MVETPIILNTAKDQSAKGSKSSIEDGKVEEGEIAPDGEETGDKIKIDSTVMPLKRGFGLTTSTPHQTNQLKSMVTNNRT